MNDTPLTLRQQYQRNLQNIKEFLFVEPPKVKEGTKNDPSIEEWEQQIAMFEGGLILMKTGLKLKKEIENEKT